MTRSLGYRSASDRILAVTVAKSSPVNPCSLPPARKLFQFLDVNSSSVNGLGRSCRQYSRRALARAWCRAVSWLSLSSAALSSATQLSHCRFLIVHPLTLCHAGKGSTSPHLPPRAKLYSSLLQLRQVIVFPMHILGNVSKFWLAMSGYDLPQLKGRN
jgi:hypothetical protein